MCKIYFPDDLLDASRICTSSIPVRHRVASEREFVSRSRHVDDGAVVVHALEEKANLSSWGEGSIRTDATNFVVINVLSRLVDMVGRTSCVSCTES